MDHKLILLKSEVCSLLSKRTLLSNGEAQTLERLFYLIDSIILRKIDKDNIVPLESIICMRLFEIICILQGSENRIISKITKALIGIEQNMRLEAK